jgi:hypothetical protein
VEKAGSGAEIDEYGSESLLISIVFVLIKRFLFLCHVLKMKRYLPIAVLSSNLWWRVMTVAA